MHWAIERRTKKEAELGKKRRASDLRIYNSDCVKQGSRILCTLLSYENLGFYPTSLQPHLQFLPQSPPQTQPSLPSHSQQLPPIHTFPATYSQPSSQPSPSLHPPHPQTLPQINPQQLPRSHPHLQPQPQIQPQPQPPPPNTYSQSSTQPLSPLHPPHSNLLLFPQRTAQSLP
nr:hypothetical protein HmN_000206800 [Hymenolepis microstoma]